MRLFALLLGLVFSIPAFAVVQTDLRTFGKDAPVQLYVFTSLTCPHCAGFHEKILPTLKKEYADTGIAQVTIVNMLTNPNGLTAAQTMRCLRPEIADKLEHELYAEQPKWMYQNAKQANKKIAEYASHVGMTQRQFNQCQANKELKKMVIEQQANLAKLYGITATPTLVMRQGTEVHKWSGANESLLDELKEALQ